GDHRHCFAGRFFTQWRGHHGSAVCAARSGAIAARRDAAPGLSGRAGRCHADCRHVCRRQHGCRFAEPASRPASARVKQPWLLLSLALVIVILIAPLLAPYDPMATNPGEALQPPGAGHLLGTDALGRDVLSRVLHGGQRTLYTAALATVVALLPGVGMGMLAAAAGGRIDAALLAVINAWLAFPALLLALVVVTLLGVGLQQVALATGAALIPQVARVARTA